jgi:peptidoglycan/LPS O-acetylase OafA/YrhL
VLLAYLILRMPAGRSFGDPQNFPALLAYLLACWTWWPFLIDGHPAGFFFVSWSISTEMFFYLCYALVLHRLSVIRDVRTCLAILIMFCLLAYALFFGLFITRDIWEPAGLWAFPGYAPRVEDFNGSFYRWLLYLSPYCRLPEFIGGVLTCQLYRLSRQQRTVFDRARPALLGLAAIVVMAMLYAQFRYFGEHDPWYAVNHFTYGAFIVNLHQNFLFAPCCFALIFSMACSGWYLARLLSSRAALFCGEISYSTYLSHEMIIAKLHLLGLDAIATVPYLAMLLAVVYVASWLLYRVIEVPAKRALRTLFDNWTLRRAALPGD